MGHPVCNLFYSHLGQYDEHPAARLCGHGDGVVERGVGREVPLVEAELVGGGAALEGGREGLVDKVKVLDGVADVDVEELVLRVERVARAGDGGAGAAPGWRMIKV